MRHLNEIYDATKPVEAEEDYFLINEEPMIYRQAGADENLQRAIDDEFKSIQENQTWKVVQPPKWCKPIRLKWVYKIKRDEERNPVKFKACLVVKGYAQWPRIDYDEVFALVARFETIWLIVGLAAQRN